MRHGKYKQIQYALQTGFKNSPVAMPANLTITQNAPGEFILRNSYPKESKANSTDTFSLIDGTMINDEKIISKHSNEEDELVNYNRTKWF